MDKIQKRLLELSNRTCWCDDPEFNPCDFSGGNYDDTYWRGHDDGQTKLANELLELIKCE